LASRAGHEVPLYAIFSILLLPPFSPFQFYPHSSVIDYIQSVLRLYNQIPNFIPYNGTSKIVSFSVCLYKQKTGRQNHRSWKTSWAVAISVVRYISGNRLSKTGYQEFLGYQTNVRNLNEVGTVPKI